ncbi:ras family-domain-containing protein [Annulohypoxylon bovei var. microspora]|nr:ras family-domain-containing protein [Annulohypoxylon bovei var. microspora]
MDSKNSARESRVSLPQKFSFTIPESWNSSNTLVLRWVNNQPDPVIREEPLPPSQFRPPTRTSEVADAVKNGDEGDGHVNKERRLSVTSVRTAVYTRRNSLVATSHGLANRVSAMYHRVFSPSSMSTSSSSFTPKSSTISGVSLKDGDRPSMRFVVVGDSGCGKSTLLMRYYRNTFVPGLEKTKFDSFIKTTKVDDREIDLELWDTSGNLQLNQLQLLSYLVFDAVFLCFSLDNIKGFVDAQNKWVDDIHKNCPGALIILLGLKKDTCSGPGMRVPSIHPHLFSSIRTAQDPEDPDTKIMQSVKYVECSAKTGVNVDLAFEEGVRMVLAEREEQIALARIKEEAEAEDGPEEAEDSAQKVEPVDDKDNSAKGLAKLFCFK